MPEFDRTSYRLACLLQQGICRLQAPDASQCISPQQDLGHCQRLIRKLEKARSRKLQRAAAVVAHDLESRLHLLREHLANYLVLLASRSRPPAVPSLRSLYGEVLGLSEEFEKTSFDLEERIIAVTTEPIELQDVYLGEFEIRLHLDRLGKPHPYDIVAIDAHPASADETVTHPHVRDKRLCEGDGRIAIRRALAEGRLADFFHVVSQVLENYNSGSAHAQLDEWFHTACNDCGTMIGPDAAHVCRACDNRLCADCAWECRACLSSLCSECGQACAKCSRRYCNVCLHECAKCNEQLCQSCLSNGKCCHDCDPQKNKSGDGEAGDLAATAAVPTAVSEADLTIQPAGLGQAAVPP